MRGQLIAVLAAALMVVPVAAGGDGASAVGSWAKPEIQQVVGRGLMARNLQTFRPDDPLTRGELADLAGGLTDSPAVRPARPGRAVTMAELDRRLVTILSLREAAAEFAAGARAGGLQPPSRFGTEVVARLLGLRTNHPAAQEDLERLPNEPAPRAEAAFSAARILALSSRQTDAVRAEARAFSVPELGSWQRQILQTAFSLVGYPYVWGGESEKLERGFDCSGFVWRVYKLQHYADEGTLADTLRGRTTYQMSGEVPAAQHIAFADLIPGDVVFFGASGPRSKPAEVDHMGIYLGNGWLVHSSRYGVALVELKGWYRDRFAWARRPLAEAGLLAATGPPAH